MTSTRRLVRALSKISSKTTMTESTQTRRSLLTQRKARQFARTSTKSNASKMRKAAREPKRPFCFWVKLPARYQVSLETGAQSFRLPDVASEDACAPGGSACVIRLLCINAHKLVGLDNVSSQLVAITTTRIQSNRLWSAPWLLRRPDRKSTRLNSSHVSESRMP